MFTWKPVNAEIAPKLLEFEEHSWQDGPDVGAMDERCQG